MMHRKIIFFFWVVAGVAVPLVCQGTFHLITGRRHTGLSWQVIESENFRIVYNRGLEEMAIRTASTAEQVYAVHRQNLGLSFKKKYPIFITDADDVTNGATSPSGYFFFWIRPSDYLGHFTGVDSWLQKVISHEMVHALMIENTKGFWDLFFPFSSLTGLANLDFYEGMAQFYAGEEWGLERGEKYLSLSLRNSDTGIDMSDIDNGPLLYAVGFSKIKWLRQKFSDAQIGGLFRLKSRWGIFGFGRSFKKTTAESYSDFCDRWRKDASVYSFWRLAQAEETSTTGKALTGIPCPNLSVIKASPDRRTYAFTGMESEQTHARSLFIWNIEKKKLRTLSRFRILPNFGFSRDSRRIVFSRLMFGKHGGMGPDLFIVDMESGRERRVTNDCRSSEPAFVRENRIVFLRNEEGGRNLYICDADGKHAEKLTSFSGDRYISDLSVSPDGGKVAASFLDSDRKKYGFFILDIVARSVSETFTPALCRFPLFAPDGSAVILYTSHENRVANVVRCWLESNERKEVTNQADYLLATDWPALNEALAIRQDRRRKNEAFTLDPGRTPTVFPGALQPRYLDWTKTTLQHPMTVDPHFKASVTFKGRFRPLSTFRLLSLTPLPLVVENRLTGGASLLASDIPGENQLKAGAAWNPVKATRPNFFLSVQHAFGNISLMTVAGYQSATTFHYSEKTGTDERIGFASVEAALPLFSPISTATHLFSFSCNYEESRLAEKRGSDTTQDETDKIAGPTLADPVAYRLGSMQVNYTYRFVFPYARSPFRGFGVTAQYAYNRSFPGGEYAYHHLRLGSFIIRPMTRQINLLVSGDFQGQWGNVIPQHRLGVARLYTFELYQHYSREVYVRGGSQYYPGNRLLTASIELRNPWLYSLLSANLSLFFDAAWVWEDALANLPSGKSLFSYGAELHYSLLDKSTIVALGVARSITEKGGWKVYVMIKSLLPF